MMLMLMLPSLAAGSLEPLVASAYPMLRMLTYSLAVLCFTSAPAQPC